MRLLDTITGEGFESRVWERTKGGIWFIGDADIDADGGNNPDDDRFWQPETTLKLRGKSIDAESVAGMVVPGWLPHRVGPIVLGCIGRVTNLDTMQSYPCVVHDTGPLRKTGEITPFLAKQIGINPNSNHGGEDRPTLLYECWPGEAALISGIQYDLQKAG